jgi:pyridoxal phosphate enzyme (YggS family)
MIAEAFASVRARIDAAAGRAGRDASAISLVAATKGVAVERVREAIEAGIADVGENKVQDLVAKRDVIGERGVRWHMIGTLQRNKVGRLAGNVALIHSVDSRELAQAIGARATRAGTRQDVLLEVNAGGEPTKHGVDTADALDAAVAVAKIDGVRLRGFMTIAPAADEARARAAFATLRELRDRASSIEPDATELSMGMTDDFEAAIEEGSTIVRIGTAIFGPRPERTAKEAQR